MDEWSVTQWVTLHFILEMWRAWVCEFIMGQLLAQGRAYRSNTDDNKMAATNR